MSAFIVNDYHLNVIVSWGSRKDVRYYFNNEWKSIKESEQDIFSKLVRANLESVNERYEENTPAMPGRYKAVYENFNIVQIIKACDCYNYQSCEVENWEETEAYKIVDAIRERAIDGIPGYDAAEWEMTPPQYRKVKVS